VAGGWRGVDDIDDYLSLYSTPRDYFEFVEAVPDGPRAGSLSSAGNSHTFCWIDPSSEVAGLVFLQPTDGARRPPSSCSASSRGRSTPSVTPGCGAGTGTPNGPDTWPIAPPEVWWPFQRSHEPSQPPSTLIS
jgi:hypothetical protein